MIEVRANRTRMIMRKGSKSKGKGKGKSKGTPNQPIAPTKPSKLWRLRRIAQVVGGIVGAIVAVITFIRTVGPPWPTSPSFTPGAPSYGAAIDIPFTIENKSALFSINNLTIVCVVRVSFVGSPNGSPPQLNGVGVRASGLPASLASSLKSMESGQMSSGSYRCPLRDTKVAFAGQNAADQIKSAQVSFHTEYDAALPWRSRVTSDDGPFTLVTTVPQYWVKGLMLK